MDHAWAVQKLKEFQKNIDCFYRLSDYQQSEFLDDDQVDYYHDLIEECGSYSDVRDRLISLNPVMRDLMNAAQIGLGNYLEPPEDGWAYDGSYWREIVRPCTLRATGIHELGEEARRRMQPDSPDLAADQFHSWVWDAAAPLWYAGNRQEAVHAAASTTTVNCYVARRGCVT